MDSPSIGSTHKLSSGNYNIHQLRAEGLKPVRLRAKFLGETLRDLQKSAPTTVDMSIIEHYLKLFYGNAAAVHSMGRKNPDPLGGSCRRLPFPFGEGDVFECEVIPGGRIALAHSLYSVEQTTGRIIGPLKELTQNSRPVPTRRLDKKWWHYLCASHQDDSTLKGGSQPCESDPSVDRGLALSHMLPVSMDG
ncbi:hypothetical protein GCK32_000400, partial [Trichostrongylus colubriformis]